MQLARTTTRVYRPLGNTQRGLANPHSTTEAIPCLRVDRPFGKIPVVQADSRC